MLTFFKLVAEGNKVDAMVKYLGSGRARPTRYLVEISQFERIQKE